ncbi:NAD-dependent epimerase/dehydratase family protein [Streptomyces sp. NBC_01190]|uniref:NAD-dependent epimerase/dehydratase family protein n=1 Tax=Streptomyces sp. NBC_01190 TaxID=2903767 RepID=UPI00386FE297|nr:NAD-dependent epimerase/dehydratase [Streptomyces sp. NBC_01190]
MDPVLRSAPAYGGVTEVRRILVLGGGGFLGTAVRTRLSGSAVTGWAEAVPAGPGRSDCPMEFRVLRGERSTGYDLTVDLARTSVDALARGLDRLAPDAVVNCAGALAGPASEVSGADARGPAVLVEAMALAAPWARLVHLGSAAEYGSAAPGTTLSEDAPARPTGLYGAAKLAGTLAVTGSGLDAVVLRVFNPVGAGAPPTGLPGRLAAALRETPPHGAVRTGGLTAYRDFVHVTDVAEAVALAATTPGPLPPVVNVGSGRATRARTLAEALAVVAGFSGRIEESGAPAARSAALDWQRADISLAARTLGWRPARTLHEALIALWRAAAAAPERAAARTG